MSPVTRIAFSCSGSVTPARFALHSSAAPIPSNDFACARQSKKFPGATGH